MHTPDRHRMAAVLEAVGSRELPFVITVRRSMSDLILGPDKSSRLFSLQ